MVDALDARMRLDDGGIDPNGRKVVEGDSSS
jgi:hypothetical protein